MKRQIGLILSEECSYNLIMLRVGHMQSVSHISYGMEKVSTVCIHVDIDLVFKAFEITSETGLR